MDESKHKKLSGGGKQRFSLARSIINDPLMILADDPTANLDKQTQ
ncbi:ATP-binding cassette domain-containing protein [Paracholeplasma manati]|uniref:ATP-binding cassette domain-containing protein n=1 Tax=Paracholeplasma manati TaxID=591373 RepID=A0ABT2YBS1_9MOLU|nr:ATP-binding cassette domain-containing protein [Paracholeplasma manati]MCV2232548.1 ATP-binding cassette domain-containing protein [Paracholeplasma manati]MDG0889041.1 ATP-binding cassette domain-containing protein [Paracholeplasma manati]MDY0276742.1 ATP-binding cassette domain-containing protein [Acholeplasma sp.]